MLLINCRLVPELSGGIKTNHGAVLIEKNKITQVYEDYAEVPSEIKEGKGTGQEKIFDCRGKTLMPGLIDLHTHIVILNGVGMDRLHDRMGMVVAAAKHAAQYLDHGFTTIRDCGSTFRVANYVREMVRNGSLEAPDIISCGRAIMPTEVEPCNPMAQHLIFADGADEVRKAARTEIAAGADFVKIFASGAAADPNGVPSQAIMTDEEVRTIVETAGRKGKYVSAHCHSDDAIRTCIENGVRTIEHATLISDDSLNEIIARKDIILIPTLAVMCVSDGPRHDYWQKRLGPMFEHCTAMMRKAYQAGVRIGFGTDCAAGSFEYENGIEFKFRRENCGMADLNILIQATKGNAEIAGIDDEVGCVSKGFKANLILVDGRPDEDISAMCGRPDAVFKNGKLVRDIRKSD